MFLKRQVPLAIVFVVGIIMLLSWFIPHEPFGNLEIHATQWFDIIASFSMILGALNLLKLQGRKVIHRQKGWFYSLAAVVGFFLTLFFGFFFKGGYYLEVKDVGPNSAYFNQRVSDVTFTNVDAVERAFSKIDGAKQINRNFYTHGGALELYNDLTSQGAEIEIKQLPWGSHLQEQGTFYSWIFYSIFTPLTSTMFALLAFFVASASYRAFKIRNLEATILLVAGIIIMIGRVPMGAYLTNWLPSWLQWLHLPNLQEWIYQYPNAAGARAIMIGIGLGIVGTSLRVILGIEKTFIGE
ncbi:MAG: hypothetical protein PHE86_03135 [Candidatus Marinimicrobia bacterium]|nr:hypothetical protein [Candidatus Neomarinimicrobiota bacterium]MDD5582753.1 hypothetical protein [Candidatus Neomarinimicrobiota bacterium]